MIGDRIKALRKDLRLNQTEFAERIGSVQNTITGYETGRREPSNQVIALICKEFHINEEWLRYGKEPMRTNAPSAVMQALSSEYRLCPEASAMVEKFIALEPSSQRVIFNYMCSVVDSLRGKRYEESDEQHDDRLRNELEKQIEKEKEDAGKSEA